MIISDKTKIDNEPKHNTINKQLYENTLLKPLNRKTKTKNCFNWILLDYQ